MGGFLPPRFSARIGHMSEIAAPSRFSIVLIRPDSPKNISLAAQGMARTGVTDLCGDGLRTAVHAESVIESASTSITYESSRNIILDSLQAGKAKTAHGNPSLVSVPRSVASRQKPNIPWEQSWRGLSGDEMARFNG